MASGEVGSSRWAGHALALGAGLLAGCAARGPELDRALMAERPPAPQSAEAVRAYQLGCPDVLDLELQGRPDLTGRKVVDAEGRIDLGDLGRVRVEGRTVPELADYLAEITGTPPDRVRVRVSKFNSQQIYLVGQVAGSQRAVAYQGPETVLDLLRRAGGIQAGAAPEDVYVVRAEVAEGRQPEVFHIDLREIVISHDEKTNIRLRPFDQVYVGETRRSRLRNCVPFCFRPVYEAVCGLRRPSGNVPRPLAQPEAPRGTNLPAPNLPDPGPAPRVADAGQSSPQEQPTPLATVSWPSAADPGPNECNPCNEFNESRQPLAPSALTDGLAPPVGRLPSTQE